jgi:tRNA pseudouridine55 synthase
MDGYLLVNKPPGISSFGVVARIRGVWREKLRSDGLSAKKAKIGHTGTLDPAASGLMILVLGSYTKKAAQFSKMDKVYKVEITLGATSTTGDSEGEIAKKSGHQPTKSEIDAALTKFTGSIMQHPPIYSAIKVGGRRAYELARAGHSFTLEARPVEIYSIEDVDYNYPKVSFTADVSSGTYIRSLAEDIGQELGVGAYMSNLIRTRIGEFDLADAISFENLDYQQLLRALGKLVA